MSILDKLKKNQISIVFGSRYEKGAVSLDDSATTKVGNFLFTTFGNLFFSLNLIKLFKFEVGEPKEEADEVAWEFELVEIDIEEIELAIFFILFFDLPFIRATKVYFFVLLNFFMIGSTRFKENVFLAADLFFCASVLFFRLEFFRNLYKPRELLNRDFSFHQDLNFKN